jgi:hypothetical protein
MMKKPFEKPKNRDEKRKETLNQIRKFLLEKDRTWQELLSEIKRSPATLSVFLAEFMKNKDVSAYTDLKDRRITYYTLNDKKKTNAEIKLYETSEFILSIENTEGFEKLIKEFEVNVEIATIGSEDKVMFEKAQKKEISLEEFLESMGKTKYSSTEEMFKKADKIEIIISFTKKKET